jgi:hypothetical protein
MRRAIAAFLLACLGMMIPLAASQVRLCLLDNRLLVAGSSECGAEKSPCCPDCGDHHEDPCCLELEDLPEAPAPVAPVTLPVAVAIDLPPTLFVAPPAVLVETAAFEASVPIRGPDSPAAWRAMLEVWRL